MKLRIRNPTGREVEFKASPSEICSIINAWDVRPGFEVRTYEQEKKQEILVVIERIIDEKNNTNY